MGGSSSGYLSVGSDFNFAYRVSLTPEDLKADEIESKLLEGPWSGSERSR
jgi:hypothetical protein